MADQAPPQPPADAGQKQKKKRIQRDFQETARWEHDQHCEDDIVDGIRSELKIVNDRAGLKFMLLCSYALLFLRVQKMIEDCALPLFFYCALPLEDSGKEQCFSAKRDGGGQQ